jgi:hypothetical protein
MLEKDLEMPRVSNMASEQGFWALEAIILYPIVLGSHPPRTAISYHK